MSVTPSGQVINAQTINQAASQTLLFFQDYVTSHDKALKNMAKTQKLLMMSKHWQNFQTTGPFWWTRDIKEFNIIFKQSSTRKKPWQKDINWDASWNARVASDCMIVKKFWPSHKKIGELFHRNLGERRKLMMNYSAFVWCWLIIIFPSTLFVIRKMQLITPTTKTVTTWLVKKLHQKERCHKNQERLLKKFKEDIGASDDSSIGSHDSC